MDEFDVLVFLVVLAIGLLIIPSHYDPLKFFLYSRRIFDELTAGISSVTSSYHSCRPHRP